VSRVPRLFLKKAFVLDNSFIGDLMIFILFFPFSIFVMDAVGDPAGIDGIMIDSIDSFLSNEKHENVE